MTFSVKRMTFTFLKVTFTILKVVFSDEKVTLFGNKVVFTSDHGVGHWGHHQRGATRYYVSSGIGIWGPKIRIGTRSEYLVLKITGNKQETVN